MTSRRYLLMHVTTSSGRHHASGHHHASRGIAQGLRRLDPDCQIINVDAFDYISRVIRDGILRTYVSLIRHHPDVWEYLYDNSAVHRRLRHLRGLLHRYHAGKLGQLLETVQPHAIACTQAFPSGMVADFKQQHGLQVPLVGVLTDYAPHVYWLHEQVDAYVVPAEEMKERFVASGIDAARIRVYGIPVESGFLDGVNREMVYREFQLDPAKPIVLVMGGAGGFGPIRELMLSLDQVPITCQVVVLAGTNLALLRWLRGHQFRQRVVVRGYIDGVASLMDVATLVITKPGGVTTAEALAKHLPMLIMTPIAGQELCNARFLLAHAAAVPIGAPERTGTVVTRLLRSPGRLASLRERAARFAYPDASLRIANLLIESAGGMPAYAGASRVEEATPSAPAAV